MPGAAFYSTEDNQLHKQIRALHYCCLITSLEQYVILALSIMIMISERVSQIAAASLSECTCRRGGRARPSVFSQLGYYVDVKLPLCISQSLSVMQCLQSVVNAKARHLQENNTTSMALQDTYSLGSCTGHDVPVLQYSRWRY